MIAAVCLCVCFGMLLPCCCVLDGNDILDVIFFFVALTCSLPEQLAKAIVESFLL